MQVFMTTLLSHANILVISSASRILNNLLYIYILPWQVVVQLLASATLSDVTEAIALLTICRKFRITGADAALRRMLPLVFSREQGASPPLALWGQG